MTPRIGIVGYRMGNITSLRNALVAIGADVFVAEEPARLRDATHVILPGVGAFPKGMEQLHTLGFTPELRRLALEERRPTLGICLGMQLLASVGEEHRICAGLGFIRGRVTLLKMPGLRVPHIGWNDTVSRRASVLSGPAGAADTFYYVHSYQLVLDDPADEVLGCTYGDDFVAGVECQNIFGVQFHPEKSHAAGLALLKRFTEVPAC
jgi:glutamine amidotransferase